jgi:hypothetical protein
MKVGHGQGILGEIRHGAWDSVHDPVSEGLSMRSLVQASGNQSKVMTIRRSIETMMALGGYLESVVSAKRCSQ